MDEVKGSMFEWDLSIDTTANSRLRCPAMVDIDKSANLPLLPARKSSWELSAMQILVTHHIFSQTNTKRSRDDC